MNVLEIIYEVIDEVNLELSESSRIEKNEQAVIFGEQSTLDSMELVNFITLVEEKLEEATGHFIPIADERAMSMESSPFKTIGSLKQYIETLINEQ